MRGKTLLWGLLLLAIGLAAFWRLAPANAAAGINKQIGFQGKVVNTDGTNVADASYTFVFKIYIVDTAGTAVWTETKSIAVTDGIFQTNLGSVTALPGSVDFNSDTLYLGVEFNSDGEMTPRIRLTAVPYAFNSDQVDGLDAADLLRSNASDTFSGANGQTLTVESSLTAGARSASLLSLTQANDVTYDSTGALLAITNSDTGSAGNLLSLSNAGSGAALFFTEGTTVANGIQWGADANAVTLYRSTDDTLKTDDSLIVGANLDVVGTTTLATSLTGLLRADSGVVSAAVAGTDYVAPGGTLFTLAGSAGDNQTISQGNTLTIAAGTDISTTGGATDTVTIANSSTLGTVTGRGATTTTLVNLNGGIAVDTSNFTVDGTTGAVVTASTLQAGDLASLNGGIAVDTSNFTVSGTTGATAIAAVNSAGAGLNALALSGTLGIMDATGTDIFRGTYLNYTNANHTGGSFYGLDIAGITADADATERAINVGAGWDVGIYIADAATYSLQLASDDGDAASGITFGTTNAANLYKSAADTLKTDDAFIAGSTLNVVGATTLATSLTGILEATAGVVGTATADSDYQQVITWGDGLEYATGTATVDYNTTNLKITATELDTIQNIDTAAYIRFNGVGLGVAASTNVGLYQTKTFAASGGATALLSNNTVSTTYTTYTGLQDLLTVTGAITNRYGVYLAEPTGAGTITNNYGLYIESMAKGGTVDQAIYLAGTGANNGILMGTDTNLYRGAANELSTDDTLTFGSAATAKASATTTFKSYVTDTGTGGAYIFDTSADISTVSLFAVKENTNLRFDIDKDGNVRMPAVYSKTISTSVRDLQIDSAGVLGYVSSSVRYKEDINNLASTDWLYDLRPVTFEYISDSTNTQQVGLIAEEVEQAVKDIYPDLVSYSLDNPTQVETVNYSKLVVPLLNATQLHNSRLSNLEGYFSAADTIKIAAITSPENSDLVITPAVGRKLLIKGDTAIEGKLSTDNLALTSDVSSGESIMPADVEEVFVDAPAIEEGDTVILNPIYRSSVIAQVGLVQLYRGEIKPDEGFYVHVVPTNLPEDVTFDWVILKREP